MTNKEKDILALFNELNSMLYEVLGDCNKALSENIELKKEIDWFKKYTDALIEHKDMVCLPADLKNLRESNAALATENEELKKKVETLNGIITQAWFTDVEEKNKQIEYLLNKVRELNDPELKDDEQLTKTFMDAQTNPKDIESDEEKDTSCCMYLNPGKHTGGNDTKKGIEFDAEKLVKSVQDYANSLQNKNEVKLKSLEEHNNSKLCEAYGGNSFKTGIACPKCGSELHYTNPGMMLSSYPPKQAVNCKKCLHADYVY